MGVFFVSIVNDSTLSISDVTTNNVSTSKHGFTPKAPNDATKFLDGTGAWDTCKDADLSFSDVTTNNASTSNHGFLKKLDNSSSNFMNGQGNWAVPAMGAGGTSIFFDPIQYYSIIQGSFAKLQDTTNIYKCSIFRNPSETQNDELNFKIYMVAGTYTFNLLHNQAAGNGIAKLKIDGSAVGTIDMYNAGDVYNVIGTITGISVASSGIKDVNILMDTKNGSSAGYGIRANMMALIQTA